MNDPTDSYNVTADQAHDDQWLADQVVALGVGYNYHGAMDWYGTDLSNPDYRALMAAEQFVRDWRVAGALMEKAADNDDQVLAWKDESGRFRCDLPNVPSERLDYMPESRESLPRAIIEACVVSLS
jgi:hypothetical protein